MQTYLLGSERVTLASCICVTLSSEALLLTTLFQGTNKLIIKKFAAHGGKERLLAVGDEKVTRDRRISIERARLVISHARPRDAGTFLCFFDIDPPVQLKHTLDVQFAPTIRSLAPPEQHVPKGTTITLECRAQGNPEPIIRWSRQEGPLPSDIRNEQVCVMVMHYWTIYWVNLFNRTLILTQDLTLPAFIRVWKKFLIKHYEIHNCLLY